MMSLNRQTSLWIGLCGSITLVMLPYILSIYVESTINKRGKTVLLLYSYDPVGLAQAARSRPTENLFQFSTAPQI